MPRVTLSVGRQPVDLHYLEAGSGPAVLLVHGLGGFAESWRHCVPALASRFTVYAVDLPGSGQSAKPRVTYDLAFFAKSLEGFLDAQRVDRASVVGHSLGGAVATAFVLSYPDRSARLALVAPVVPGARDFYPTWLYQVVAIPALGELIVPPKALVRYSIRRCFVSVEPEELEFLLTMTDGIRTTREGRRAFVGTLRDVSRDLRRNQAVYARHLGDLPTDVLLVFGSADPVVPLEHVEAARALLPRPRVLGLRECGHFPQIEKASEFTDHLVPFLSGDAFRSGELTGPSGPG